ncbi:MAG: hypothetical protein QG585_473 [Patescibacteria group bacterium]|nr:hypothetical protein [Patescibacteria group bacterium]
MKVTTQILESLIEKPCYFSIELNTEDLETVYHGVVTGFVWREKNLTINIRGFKQTEEGTGPHTTEDVEFLCTDTDQMLIRKVVGKCFFIDTPSFLCVFETNGSFAGFLSEQNTPA